MTMGSSDHVKQRRGKIIDNIGNECLQAWKTVFLYQFVHLERLFIDLQHSLSIWPHSAELPEAIRLITPILFGLPIPALIDQECCCSHFTISGFLCWSNF
ncbi:hypothetical protein AMECASPLE_003348 [Ameca splendens]|uniref:Uncharacterized protein n=1 Tax=Ameca splendens TaxID=208324 RepID=A0ABV0Y9R2_9TELE